MTEVIKDTFEVRMTTRKLVANIKKLDRRITEIENKQAERFPHLIERLDRIEGSFPAIVDRLKTLELENNSGMDYSGAFETDIDYG